MTPASISIDLRGIASVEVPMTDLQRATIIELVAQYRAQSERSASTFILGQIFMSYSEPGQGIPKLRFYVTPRKLGVSINQTIKRFLEKGK